MGTYTYKVLTKEQKIKKGSIEALEFYQAKELLRDKGYTIISLKEASFLHKEISFEGFAKRVMPRDLSVFCRQMGTILEAGVGIIQALEMLSKQTENKRLQKVLKEIQIEVERGNTLTEAMGLYEEIFPSLFIHMIEAGETTGSLEISFKEMADYFEKEARLKGLVKKAMIYPSAVGIVAIGVIIIMMSFVVPNFMGMFSSMNLEMPAVTLFVVGISDFIVRKGYLLAIGFLVFLIGFRFYSVTEKGQEFISKSQLKIPFLGMVLVKTASSQFVRTLRALLMAGVSMIEALEITSNIMQNWQFKKAVLLAREQVMEGNRLVEHLKSCGLFPPMVYYMIGIGEEAGKIEEMLYSIAIYYDEEVEIATTQFLAALEPIIIVLLALIVGGILGAIMLPMLTLYNAVGGM